MAGKVGGPSGGGKRGRLEVTADPNVIPFIDVMLVLLIIFMIAAPISSVDIEVLMPKSDISPSDRPPRPTWVSISDSMGNIRVYVMNDEITNLADIGEETYKAVLANAPRLAGDEEKIRAQRIYIRADSTTPYRNVVRVMNRLQDKGFTKIGLVAEDRS